MLAICPSTLDTEVFHEDFNDEINIIYWTDRQMHKPMTICFLFVKHKILRRDMRFPTMWYVGPAKAQTSLHIPTVWLEPLLVAWIFYDC